MSYEKEKARIYTGFYVLYCFLDMERCRPHLTAHSHSIINRPPKPVWLKGLAVIEKSLYRRSYRQKSRPFASAGLRGIGISSISTHHT